MLSLVVVVVVVVVVAIAVIVDNLNRASAVVAVKYHY